MGGSRGVEWACRRVGAGRSRLVRGLGLVEVAGQATGPLRAREACAALDHQRLIPARRGMTSVTPLSVVGNSFSPDAFPALGSKIKNVREGRGGFREGLSSDTSRARRHTVIGTSLALMDRDPLSRRRRRGGPR